MLVFGESILNDAVAIVLTNVIVESKRQLGYINGTKLTAYSMIGLLASSNLTTLPSAVTTSVRHRNHNGLIQNAQQPAFYDSSNDPSADFLNQVDKYPARNNEYEGHLEPDMTNDYDSEGAVSKTRKRKKGTCTVIKLFFSNNDR
jgi:hypothetical protein